MRSTGCRFETTYANRIAARGERCCPRPRSGVRVVARRGCRRCLAAARAHDEQVHVLQQKRPVPKHNKMAGQIDDGLTTPAFGPARREEEPAGARAMRWFQPWDAASAWTSTVSKSAFVACAAEQSGFACGTGVVERGVRRTRSRSARGAAGNETKAALHRRALTVASNTDVEELATERRELIDVPSPASPLAAVPTAACRLEAVGARVERDDRARASAEVIATCRSAPRRPPAALSCATCARGRVRADGEKLDIAAWSGYRPRPCARTLGTLRYSVKDRPCARRQRRLKQQCAPTRHATQRPQTGRASRRPFAPASGRRGAAARCPTARAPFTAVVRYGWRPAKSGGRCATPSA